VLQQLSAFRFIHAAPNLHNATHSYKYLILAVNYLGSSRNHSCMLNSHAVQIRKLQTDLKEVVSSSHTRILKCDQSLSVIKAPCQLTLMTQAKLCKNTWHMHEPTTCEAQKCRHLLPSLSVCVTSAALVLFQGCGPYVHYRLQHHHLTDDTNADWVSACLNVLDDSAWGPST
jgi:hypothetical protein